MNTIKEILQVVLSWTTVAIVAIIMIRKPLAQLIDRLIHSDSGKAKVGPAEIEFGKIVEESH